MPGKSRFPIGTPFHERLHKTESGCWEWMGSKARGGYGHFSLNDRFVLSHRYAYEQAYGSIPQGFYVCHRCDNPACCNPDHLFLGTPGENNADRDAKGRGKLKSPESRKRLAEVIRARGVIWQQIEAIDTQLKTGKSQSQVAREFGVSRPAMMRSIRKYRAELLGGTAAALSSYISAQRAA